MNSLSRSFGNNGFTLVELMLTLVVSTVMVVAIGTSYVAQQKSQVTQDQVTEMQQNLRAAMNLISSEMRMAGYKPPGVASEPGIQTATQGRFRFTWDNTDTVGGNIEDIEYGFPNADDNDGGAADGIADAGSASLGRQVNNAGGFQPIADNIDAIEFLYTLENLTQTTTPAAVDEIRAVTITLLARASRPEQGFLNNFTYTTASGTVLPAANDNFRRRLLTTTVHLRNLGL